MKVDKNYLRFSLSISSLDLVMYKVSISETQYRWKIIKLISAHIGFMAFALCIFSAV